MRNFFNICKNTQVSDKAILRRLVITVTVMIVCLTAMSVTAYAYFSHSVISGLNIISSAHFQASVQVSDSFGAAVDVARSDDTTYIAKLKGGQVYNVTLQHSEQSNTQTGFVIITTNNSDAVYHTQQIGRYEDGSTKTVTFTIKPISDTEVTFYSNWGTSSQYQNFKDIVDNTDFYINNSEMIMIMANETISDVANN